MNILMLAHRFPPSVGGVETHVNELSQQLTALGHTVTVYTSNLEAIGGHGRHAAALARHTSSGVAIERYGAIQLSSSLDAAALVPGMAVRTLVSAGQFDVIHAHSYGYFSSMVGALVAPLRQTPLVFTPHFAAETVVGGRIRAWYDRFVGRWTLRRADQIIALTTTEQRALQVLSQLGADRFSIIPNGVDLHRFSGRLDSERLRTRFGIEPHDKIILSVCRMAPNKGLDYLARAGRRILDRIPQARFVMVGQDWGLQPVVTAIAKQAGFADRVTFTGKISDEQLAGLYRQADVFCLPSIGGEAFGVVFLEAMAAGVPIVATAVGGVPDVVTDRTNGFVVAPKSAGALADRIIQLLTDHTLARTIAAANHLKAQRYTWPAIAKQTESVYIDVSRNNLHD